ncbi:feruloyl esterase B precursor [Karstenula rhodostoma CBS 690.94]|uniref:Carboxylic ester hydrolase n=1 Tax=Karstenula rhodostoma CBS 690.94 TaxID=1392251 RepID=A0A9P4U559_9PLEO|nr:feruloyl esterase B precursor [Karstenula rhodostoma CBS 690.94]
MAPLLFLLQLWATVEAATTDNTKTIPCEASSFIDPVVPGARIISITTEERRNFDIPGVPKLLEPMYDLNFCDVQVYLTHPGTNDKVLVKTWLPLTPDLWNDRFQATGGGGWATGLLDLALGPALASGYAASSTDGGHPVDYFNADWTLNDDKTVNWDLLQNFGTRSLADLIYVGKSLTEQYYGQQPRYSYWNGCSQGGRQGYAVAQRYPDLIDGVLAVAPALRFPAVTMSFLWPNLVMKETGTVVSNCEFNWFASKALEECDILDGAKDGVIGDPEACTFDPRRLVGQKLECSGVEIEVTETMAEVVYRVHEGPSTPFGAKVFPSLTYGTSFSTFVNATTNPDGIRTLNDPGLDVFARTILLKKSDKFDISKLTSTEFWSLWVQTNEDYGWIMDADNSDMSAFRDAGGKLLSWHGTNDDVIPHMTTVKHRQRVERELGGAKAVDEFFRLFLAPGVKHCAFGNGAVPKDPLETLRGWVEKGEAPDTLTAETKNENNEIVTRDLCRYPRTSRYLGVGDVNRASSWTCEGSDEKEEPSMEKKTFRDEL